MIWWEKTVEYYFVKKYVEFDMLVAPMDGNEEAAADVILSNVDKWILIEFKRNKSQIVSEKRKFIDYEQARSYLFGKDGHHFLIYGDVDDYEKFCLKSLTYFSDQYVEIEDVVKRGVMQYQLIEYLKEFLGFKETADGSGGGSITSYPYVAGIATNGSIIKCMTLNEFSEQHGLQLRFREKQVATQTRTHSSKPR